MAKYFRAKEMLVELQGQLTTGENFYRAFAKRDSAFKISTKTKENSEKTHQNINCPKTTGYNKYFDPQRIYPSNPCQQKILLITQYRGGSTLSAEFFNQLKNAVYLFEPLAMYDIETIQNMLSLGSVFYDHKIRGEKYFSYIESRQIEVLNDLYDCKLPDLDKILTDEFLAQVKKYNLKKKQANRLRSFREQGMIFPSDTKNIYENPFCPNSVYKEQNKWPEFKKCLTNQENGTALFKERLKTHWTNFCRSKSIISSKVIRFERPEVLLKTELYQDPNFKIILVIRDPRGILNSRLKNYTYLKDKKLQFLKKNIVQLKYRYLSYLKLLEIDPQNQKILILRYEDFAVNTNAGVKKIFEFLNYDIINNEDHKKAFINISEKLYQQTNAKDNSNVKISFGTGSRNASETIIKWAKELPWRTVEKIQNGFGDEETWKRFGYPYFGSREEYENYKPVKNVRDNWFDQEYRIISDY